MRRGHDRGDHIACDQALELANFTLALVGRREARLRSAIQRHITPYWQPAQSGTGYVGVARSDIRALLAALSDDD